MHNSDNCIAVKQTQNKLTYTIVPRSAILTKSSVTIFLLVFDFQAFIVYRYNFSLQIIIKQFKWYYATYCKHHITISSSISQECFINYCRFLILYGNLWPGDHIWNMNVKLHKYKSVYFFRTRSFLEDQSWCLLLLSEEGIPVNS